VVRCSISGASVLITSIVGSISALLMLCSAKEDIPSLNVSAASEDQTAVANKNETMSLENVLLNFKQNIIGSPLGSRPSLLEPFSLSFVVYSGDQREWRSNAYSLSTLPENIAGKRFRLALITKAAMCPTNKRIHSTKPRLWNWAM